MRRDEFGNFTARKFEAKKIHKGEDKLNREYK
jgi:hypothetical protein